MGRTLVSACALRGRWVVGEGGLLDGGGVGGSSLDDLESLVLVQLVPLVGRGAHVVCGVAVALLSHDGEGEGEEGDEAEEGESHSILSMQETDDMKWEKWSRILCLFFYGGGLLLVESDSTGGSHMMGELRAHLYAWT